MNVLDGFKTLYTAGGGQENLDELQGNKDQNMHSVIYGDGLDTTLPSNIENDVLSIAKGGVSGLDVELYIVDAPTTDPDAPSDWVKSVSIGGGLSLTEDGAALTFADVKRLIDSKSRVKIQNRGVWCFPIGEQLIHIEEDTLTAKFVISDSNGEWLQLGVELFAPET